MLDVTIYTRLRNGVWNYHFPQSYVNFQSRGITMGISWSCKQNGHCSLQKRSVDTAKIVWSGMGQYSLGIWQRLMTTTETRYNGLYSGWDREWMGNKQPKQHTKHLTVPITNLRTWRTNIPSLYKSYSCTFRTHALPVYVLFIYCITWYTYGALLSGFRDQ